MNVKKGLGRGLDALFQPNTKSVIDNDITKEEEINIVIEPNEKEVQEISVSKIVTNENESKINDIILNERDEIKKYVSSLQKNEEGHLPKHVSKVVNLYLSEKVKV